MKRPIIVLGTASGVGKSTIALALCRHLAQKGVEVAPFKGLNMARHGYSIPEEGASIGIAQGAQAEACGIRPTGLMNPVFLKVRPEGTDIYLNGKFYASAEMGRSGDYTDLMRETACDALDILQESYEMVILEGSGSCSEINLKNQDVANLFMAAYAEADILLVADIDRGGVFASIVGTLGLMDSENRRRVKGVVINRFRGDPERFADAKKQIEFITGVPVVGIVPCFDPGIDPEDDLGHATGNTAGLLDVAVIQMPNMSSSADIMPLAVTPGIGMRSVHIAAELGAPDLIFIPGSYNSMNDNDHLIKTGLDKAIVAAHARGSAVFGICGGLQIMGKRLENPNHIEGPISAADGLGLFNYTTTFRSDRVAGVSTGEAFVDGECFAVTGRESHCGHTDFGALTPFTTYTDGNLTGVIDAERWLFATYKHGIFENTALTQRLIDLLLVRRGLSAGDIVVPDYTAYKASRYDAICAHVTGHMNLGLLGI